MNKPFALTLILTILLISCKSYDIYQKNYEKIVLDGIPNTSGNTTDNNSKMLSFIEKFKKKTVITLEDCYALALLYNEKLKIAGEDYIQSILEKDKAYSMVLPTVKLKWQHFRQESVPSFGGSTFSPRKRTEYWMTFSQPIFSGLRDIYTLRAAKANVLSKEYSLRYEKIELFLLVVSTFYEILKLQQQIKTLEGFLKARTERLNEMIERQKAGLVRETEVLLIETQIEETKTLLTQSKNNLEILTSRMENIIGIDIDNKTLVDTYLPEETDTLQNLIERAYHNRYDLKSQETRILALKEQLKAIKGEYLPTVTFNNNTYFKRVAFQKQVDWDALIVAELPIFEGFLTKTKIKETESKMRQAYNVYELLKKSIKEEVETFYYDLRSSESIIAQLNKQVELAQKNYDLLREEYAQKIATNLELLFADVFLQEAKMKLEAEKLNRKALQLKLKAIIGKEVFGNE